MRSASLLLCFLWATSAVVQVKWTFVGTSTGSNYDFPTKRYRAMACTDGDTTWIYGGSDAKSINNRPNCFADLWNYNYPNWTAVDYTRDSIGVCTPPYHPPSLELGVCWVSGGSFWAYGGRTFSLPAIGLRTHAVADLWRYDGEWHLENVGDQPSCTNGFDETEYHPGALDGPSAWTVNGTMFLFGGRTETEEKSDVWRYDGGNWTKVVACSNDSSACPIGRRLAANWLDSNGSLWIFGGLNGDDRLNDLWKLDTNYVWTRMDNHSSVSGVKPSHGRSSQFCPKNTPGARFGACSWIDPRGWLVLFGGNFQTGATYNDVWVLDPSTSLWAWLSGGLKFEDNAIVPPLFPASRFGASCWTNGNVSFIFGGAIDTMVTGGMWSLTHTGDFDECQAETYEAAQNSPYPDSTTNSHAVPVAVGVIVGITVVMAVVTILVTTLLYRRRRSLHNYTFFVKKDLEIESEELHHGEQLGEGKFGIVFKGRWRNADVAIKILRNQNQFIEDFKAEMENMRAVKRHPNVVQLMGFCTQPGKLCIVIEYLAGGSLWNLIVSGNVYFDLKDQIKFALHTAAGMTHLHSENLLHCDLAARNLLVTSPLDGTIKVSDFGLSKYKDHSVLGKDDVLPMRWSAPEVLNGEKATTKSDVWSFGVVLYEIFEEKVPYHTYGGSNLKDDILNGLRLEKPGNIPDEVYKIMQRCHHKKASKRPEFSEIHKRLERFDPTEYLASVARNRSNSDQASADNNMMPEYQMSPHRGAQG